MLRHARGRALPVGDGIGGNGDWLATVFEVGLVLMVPIIFVIARQSGQPLLKVAIPALAGMTALHALMPPHPGPLIAVSALHADLGLTMLLGLCLAIPAVILAGPLLVGCPSACMWWSQPSWARCFPPRSRRDAKPTFAVSLLIILLPVLLMLGST